MIGRIVNYNYAIVFRIQGLRDCTFHCLGKQIISIIRADRYRDFLRPCRHFDLFPN